MTARRLEFLVPGDLSTATGGYAYARRILAGLRALGWRVEVGSFDPSFPRPTPASLCDAERRLAAIPAGVTVVIDGLALGAMPEVVERHANRLDLVALVHHPLALETGLAPDEIEHLRCSERRALACVRTVIVTSPATARALDAYGVPTERLRVVVPGTDPAPLAIGSGGERIRLLCVATLTPRKGHAVLFEALASLRHLPWELSCVGSRERDPDQTRTLTRMIAGLDLAERIRLSGELSESALAERYRTADVFVLASHHEGYGMALAEALARGLPILATTAGAIPETVPKGAGLLVPPGDPEALSDALRRFMEDAHLRERLGTGARRARASLPTWESASQAFAAALDPSPSA